RRGPEPRPERRGDAQRAAQPRRRRAGRRGAGPRMSTAHTTATTADAPGTDPRTDGFVSTYADVTRVRIEDPARFARLAAPRRHRPVPDTDGTMIIIAADHTGRGSFGATSR